MRVRYTQCSLRAALQVGGGRGGSHHYGGVATAWWKWRVEARLASHAETEIEMKAWAVDQAEAIAKAKASANANATESLTATAARTLKALRRARWEFE
jgi:hypothetical protein